MKRVVLLIAAATALAAAPSGASAQGWANAVIPDAVGQAMGGAGGRSCIAHPAPVDEQMLPIMMEGMRRYLTMAAAGGAQDYTSLFLMRAGRPTWVRHDQASGVTTKANRHTFEQIDDPFAVSFLAANPTLPEPDLFQAIPSFMGGMHSGATGIGWWSIRDADGRRVATYMARFIAAGGEFKLNRLEIDIGPESALDTLYACEPAAPRVSE